MNEDLTRVVDAVATKIGMAADALVPITETLVRETATKYAMLEQVHGVIAVGFAFFALVSLVAFIPSVKAALTDDDYVMVAFPVGLVALLCIIGTAINGSLAIEHAAKAASPTLTLLESVLR